MGMLDSLGDSCKNLLPVATLAAIIYGVFTFLGFQLQTTVIIIFLVFIVLLLRTEHEEIQKIKENCKKMHGYISSQAAILIILVLLIIYLIFSSLKW